MPVHNAGSLQGFVGFGQQPWFTVPTTTSPFPTLAREYLPLGAFSKDFFPCLSTSGFSSSNIIKKHNVSVEKLL